MTRKVTALPPADTYYCGRGAGACMAVQIVPGNYARVFIGNAKNNEMGEVVFIQRQDLMTLSDFFKSVYQDRGMEIFQNPIVDDPHDEQFIHFLDMSQVERG